jgi:hypothetical protein
MAKGCRKKGYKILFQGTQTARKEIKIFGGGFGRTSFLMLLSLVGNV